MFINNLFIFASSKFILMENNTRFLTFIFIWVFIFSLSAIVTDIIEIDIIELEESVVYQKSLKGNNTTFLTSEKSLRYSAYGIRIAQIGLRIYLLFGFFYLFKLLQLIKGESYFTKSTIINLKKASAIFINYCIYIFVFEIIFLFVISEKENILLIVRHHNLDIIAIAGISFSILSKVFKKGLLLQNENDLTI